MKKIFVCSPLRAQTPREYGANITLARVLCRRVVDNGDAPFAPHLFYPQFLVDEDEEQRAKGILCGESFLLSCDELWAYVKRPGLPSAGMRFEIDLAMRAGIKVDLNPKLWEGL